jgi:hypothetical protein
MTFKTLLLSAFLIPVSGIITAAVWRHLRKTNFPGVVESVMPAAGTEYGRILERFRGPDSTMDLSGTISIYDGANDNMLKEEKPFRYVRYGNQYLSQLSCLQTFCDGDLVLTVDTLHRRMTVTELGPATRRNADLFGASPAILFSDTSKFRLSGIVEQQQGLRILSLHSDFNPEIRTCRLIYDTLTYRLHRTEVEWWKDRSGRDTTRGHIWLARVDYRYRSRGSMDIAREIRTFIDVGRTGVKPTARYQGYELRTNEAVVR